MTTRSTPPWSAVGRLDARHVRAHLETARRRVLALTEDLDGERLFGPRLACVNPVLWELGHVAWFQERWCLRRRADGTFAPSPVAAADSLYDSSRVAHDSRWDLALLPLAATHDYLASVLERVLAALTQRSDDEALLYFAELCASHEDMHAEALHQTRQTLGFPPPRLPAGPARPTGTRQRRDVELAGGSFLLGALSGGGFVHDNEKWAHEVCVAPFRISSVPVTQGELAEFVEQGGYARREWWSDEGWRWRSSNAATAPRYWTWRDGVWLARSFDAWRAIEPDLPAIHVSWHEAQAWCRFAGRRLPSEAEWELAACGGADAPKPATPWGAQVPDVEHANLEGCAPIAVDACAAGDTPSGARQMLGNVWEWTASTFTPYPGFEPDPYADYSQPWFGTHKVLRGGSFASPARLLRTTWRNFYTPDRADVFAGFRTCALDP
jgi:iron(II)-dependent oxidoreductase